MSSFFVADNKIDINQESIAVPSNNGLSYNPGQQIELKIDPAQVKFFQPKNSYLQFNVKLQMPSNSDGEVCKLMLDSHIGAQSLIKEIRIFDGNSNALLEEVVGYNVACGVKYDYHTNDSIKNKRAISEGAGNRRVPVGQLGTNDSHQNAPNNPFTNLRPDEDTTTALTNDNYQNVKVCLPINTGIFQNDRVFPTMLTSGLRVSILLEESRVVMRMLEGCMLNRKTYLNPFIHSQNGCLTSSASATSGQFQSGTAYTKIFLTQDNGYWDVENLPFVVGETIGIYKVPPGSPGHVALTPLPKITGIAYNSTTKVVELTTSSFTPGANIETNANASHVIFSMSVDVPATFNATYQVSDVELVLQSVDMGSNYENDMLRRMREGGTINYDFLSMTNYRYSQLAGDIVANIQLPIENRRMKSVLCIPTDATHYTMKEVLTASGTYEEEESGTHADYYSFQDRCGLVGISDNIQSYQFLYDGRLQPSRLVDCSKTSSKTSISQQQLIELEKALSGAGISGQSLLSFNKNFVIGRAVAVQNGIYDGRNRQFALQVNYTGTSPTKNKLWNNFVFHIRRLIIKGDSISVEV